MNERTLELERRIREDLEVVDELWARLKDVKLGEESGEDELIIVGYRLHNLYNAVENIFRNIAQSFGNDIDGRGGWHAELLERMRLDLTPLRPAVIDKQTFGPLDELRRFRHLFRSLYSGELDSDRMALVLRKTRSLQELFPERMERFLDFLRELDG